MISKVLPLVSLVHGKASAHLENLSDMISMYFNEQIRQVSKKSFTVLRTLGLQKFLLICHLTPARNTMKYHENVLHVKVGLIFVEQVGRKYHKGRRLNPGFCCPKLKISVVCECRTVHLYL